MFLSCILLAASLVTMKPYSVNEKGKVVCTGRLGDQTLILAKANWVAYKFGIPWTYYPFEGSHLFDFSNTQHVHSPVLEKRKQGMFPNTLRPLQDRRFYIVNMLWQDGGWEHPIEVGLWHTAIHDPGYKKALQKSLKPKIPTSKLNKPAGTHTVALHIRTGTDQSHSHHFYEHESLKNTKKPRGINISGEFPHGSNQDILFPYKFPPHQFYIDRIHDLYQMLGKAPLHIYLFTDFNPAQELLTLFETIVKLPGVTFSLGTVAKHYRSGHTTEFETTLGSSIEDIYLMAQCDHLIRGRSNFAQIAHLVGTHEIVLFPIEHAWYDGDKLAFPKVGIYEASTRSTFLLNTLDKNDLKKYRSLTKINVEK